MKKRTEIIWVDREFAAKWKQLTDEEATRELEEKVFSEYITTVSESIMNDFRANLEVVEEEAAIFSGLMLKTRQAFEKVKNEHLSASYAAWEAFDADIVATNKKVDAVLATLRPLAEKLEEINALFGKINTYSIDRFLTSIQTLAGTYGEPRSREMVEFLVKHFSPPEGAA